MLLPDSGYSSATSDAHVDLSDVSGHMHSGRGPACDLGCFVLCLAEPCLCQDFAVSSKTIFDLWSQRKLTHDIAKKLAVSLRVMGAERLTASILWMQEREYSFRDADAARTLRTHHESALHAFKCSDDIVEWHSQFAGDTTGKKARFKALLLQGSSRTGKTRKAISLFGHEHTLVVNCQGLGSNMPSLRGFRRSEHLCIIFDEASSQQVLANKMVFQAGVDKLTMSQSQCNTNAYEVWLYSIPMVLCSNDFQLTSRPSAPMAPEDEEYLRMNIVDASLPNGEAWFYTPRSPSDTEDEYVDHFDGSDGD